MHGIRVSARCNAIVVAVVRSQTRWRRQLQVMLNGEGIKWYSIDSLLWWPMMSLVCHRMFVPGLDRKTSNYNFVLILAKYSCIEILYLKFSCSINYLKSTDYLDQLWLRSRPSNSASPASLKWPWNVMSWESPIWWHYVKQITSIIDSSAPSHARLLKDRTIPKAMECVKVGMNFRKECRSFTPRGTSFLPCDTSDYCLEKIQ